MNKNFIVEASTDMRFVILKYCGVNDSLTTFQQTRIRYRLLLIQTAGYLYKCDLFI